MTRDEIINKYTQLLEQFERILNDPKTPDRRWAKYSAKSDLTRLFIKDLKSLPA